jgi:hypothetical protein
VEGKVEVDKGEAIVLSRDAVVIRETTRREGDDGVMGRAMKR